MGDDGIPAADRFRAAMHVHPADYRTRAQAVYWDRDTEACRAKGRGKAECLLTPGHFGPHLGNGFDDYGPTNPIEWAAAPEEKP